MKKRPAFPIGKALLILAALVQGTQYIYAFMMVHSGNLAGLAIGGGVLAGGVVVGAVAYAGGRLPLIRSKRARGAAWVAFLILLSASPLILCPVNWYSMDSGLRAAIGGYSWPLAGLVASVPELAIALLAFTDRDLLPAAQPAKLAAQPATSTARPAKSARRLAESTAQPARVYACNVPGCSYTTEKQPALAAHISHHRRKARADALAGALFENVKGGSL